MSKTPYESIKSRCGPQVKSLLCFGPEPVGAFEAVHEKDEFGTRKRCMFEPILRQHRRSLPIHFFLLTPFGPAVKAVSCDECQDHARYRHGEKDLDGAKRHHFLEASGFRRLPMDNIGAHQCLKRIVSHGNLQPLGGY